VSDTRSTADETPMAAVAAEGDVVPGLSVVVPIYN